MLQDCFMMHMEAWLPGNNPGRLLQIYTPDPNQDSNVNPLIISYRTKNIHKIHYL